MPVEFLTQKVSIIFCFVGVVGNLLSFSLCLRKQLRNIPTFVIIAFTSIINIITLVSSVLFTFNIQDVNIGICKLVMIVTLCGFQSSIFLSVNIEWIVFGMNFLKLFKRDIVGHFLSRNVPLKIISWKKGQNLNREICGMH